MGGEKKKKHAQTNIKENYLSSYEGLLIEIINLIFLSNINSLAISNVIWRSLLCDKLFLPYEYTKP